MFSSLRKQFRAWKHSVQCVFLNIHQVSSKYLSICKIHQYIKICLKWTRQRQHQRQVEADYDLDAVPSFILITFFVQTQEIPVGNTTQNPASNILLEDSLFTPFYELSPSIKSSFKYTLFCKNSTCSWEFLLGTVEGGGG